jgi:hypothetical protein
MKTVILSDLKPGSVFCYAEREFVVLDELDGGILVLEHQSHEVRSFTASGKSVSDFNDFRTSSIREYLNEDYLQALIDDGAYEDVILDLTIDLKATDGTRVYGFDRCKIGLLTLQQYGKYKEIIPANEDDWWWLATPWATRWLRSPNIYSSTCAWLVYTDGSCSSNDCSNSNGVRPALRLSSDLLVSLDVDDLVSGLKVFSTKELADEIARRLGKEE